MYGSKNIFFFRLHEKKLEYVALEDEFRMALKIESDRYNKVNLHLSLLLFLFTEINIYKVLSNWIFILEEKEFLHQWQILGFSLKSINFSVSNNQL